MNREALFSDGTENYVFPAEVKANSQVTIRFRTAVNDVNFVRVFAGARGYLMRKVYTQGEFDYYEFTGNVGEEPIHYCFEIDSGDEVCYYNRCGVSDTVVEEYAFTLAPGFSTPDWAKGAVMYQIYVDRFYNGDASNDVESGEYIYIGEPCSRVTDWEKCPAFMGVREFYGGDLQGVLDKLDYLQDLGVEVIYFNPLFVSPSNHKYDIQDYDYIDPHYGKIVKDGGEVLAEDARDNTAASKYRQRVTDKENLEASNALFARLVQEMHRRGMKVIIDGVFNHCGSFNKWLDRERLYEDSDAYDAGAYVSKNSPYHSFFRFGKEEDAAWPYNGSYDGWWGHDTLPKLNYEGSERLEEYILNIGRKWVSEPYCVDGWRLDVAADLGHSQEYNHSFWKKFRNAVKEANPNAIILAEHYGNPRAWLQGDEWDTVMNYDAFMEPVTWFLTGMEKHSDDARPDLYGNAEHFVGAMKHHMADLLPSSLMVAMNELSNHDHSRFLTRTNHMVGRVQKLGYEAAGQFTQEAVMRQAVAMQMTWIGAPTLYYGDEAGVVGFTDPDNRRTYPWGKENQELLKFHKEAIRMHRESEALRRGSLEILLGKDNLVAYGRFTEYEKYVVVVNASEEEKTACIPVWRVEVPAQGPMSQCLYSDTEGYSFEKTLHKVEDGELCVTMPANAVRVFQYKMKRRLHF
ncbi:MAG: glycoside hydrolase family 13 protein [Faecalimonas sp.]|nr:glycoside hydrolase family 13 protein [Faecalimonas sp.]